MTIGEHLDEFHGQPVVDFQSEDDWVGPDKSYRIKSSWDEGAESIGEMLEELAAVPEAAQLKAIVIGLWGSEPADKATEVIDALANLSSSFPKVTGLFLGDISFEENEMSWIEQGDVAPLLLAYSKLKEFWVRGGSGLTFSTVKNSSLEILGIQTGGLPRSILRELTRCEFPNLKTLELWIGDVGYGWNGTPEDLQPLLGGGFFPKLTSLGICNCDGIDEFVPLIVNAPLMSRLTKLDLSKGNLSDVGARSLLELKRYPQLKTLDLSHHYLSEEMVAQLRKELSCEVIADDPQEADGEWRSIYVSE